MKIVGLTNFLFVEKEKKEKTVADLPSASDYSDLDTPAGSPGIVSGAEILNNSPANEK